ncbi:UDP-N-acetylglucosamine--N-acetylmuramyl-(pentapeptide) pyrophosphoryl-undecaprenol N-acetylglucosamine transferase [Haloferula luteola]|uniref:UDP-N-acetylglucosamine--N-acetylmuramyl-(pentapeptide) pyrophosphoryl-undecaprenol N-acetylglucosamine transferase n=1 Tax=Haloferula luteola TaxID=595692 RepID=A0A840VHX4_9BACT|nr:undecaprenyldiphospho-muramoylpentapeptide beta-N-acetylglucosaminyltransferase [Haloferula luteola]MBB5352331.1 UDP-N-acetylglucosamine--N-acetylmuramyl-(pentapeptide) pyrophosphoryl-undecaprenol N-acetylglucosamine transferase [Haloferula luteola]
MEKDKGKPGLVIACGGTGGHLFPGLAVAEAWTAAGGRVLLLVSEKPIDREASRKYDAYRFETIPALPKPATFSPRMLPFLVSVWKTIRTCRGLLRSFQADAVLGMGGFTSLPPVVAAKKAGIPAFVHDSNALPGKANRITSRWCDEVFLGMEAARSHFPGKTCVVTGTPVRRELTTLPERSAAAAKWGLDPHRPTLLVMGGSQGARKLNSLVAEAPLDAAVQVLHIAGPGDESRVQEEVGEREGYRIVGFCDDMASAYAVADAVVARSGASSLTELADLGLPSLLVPFPFAAEDHQTVNARVFEEAGAAILEQEKDLDGAKVASLVSRMLEPQERTRMAKAAKSLSIPDAAKRVCEAIGGLMEKGGSNR